MIAVLRSLAYIRPYWRLALLALLSLLAATIFSLVVPQVLREVVDRGLPQPLIQAIFTPRFLAEGLQIARPRPQLIFVSAALLLGLSFFRATVAFGQRFFGERLSQYVSYDMRNEFYDKVQRLPFSYHDQSQMGQIITRAITDVDAVRTFIAQALVDGVNVTLLMIGVMVAMISLSPSLALVALLPVPLIMIVAVNMGRMQIKRWYAIMERMSGLSNLLEENVIGIQVVRAFNREEQEADRWAEINQELWHAQVNFTETWSTFFPLMAFLVACCTALMLWQGGPQVINHLNWPDAIRAQEREYPRATIGAPLMSASQVIGVIGLAYAEVGPTFSEEDISLFKRFVELASIALDNARLYSTSQTELLERTRAEEKLRQQNEYLMALNETTLALMNRLDVDDLLEAILNRAASLLHTPQGYFYLLEPDGHQMRARVMLGSHERLKGVLTLPGEGLVGEAWQRGDLIVLDDYANWDGAMAEMMMEPPHAIMVAPLKSGNLVIGVIGLGHSEVGLTFTSDEIELFKHFVELASIALDNARLYSAAQFELFERQRAEEKLRRQNEYLTVLNETTLALMNRLDISDLIEAILSRAAALLRTPQGHFNLLEPDGQQMRVRVILGPRQHLLDTFAAPDEGISGHVWRTGQMLVLDDYLAWDGAMDLMVPEPPRATMVAPLKSGDQVVGLLGVAHSEPGITFKEDEIELFKRFVELATITLDNARLYSELEQRVEERTAELQRRQAQLSAVLDAIGEGVFYNEQSHIRYTNRALGELTGYSTNELIDKPSTIFMGRNSSERDVAQIAKELAQSGRRWRGEVDLRRKDGSEFSAALTVTLITDPQDNITGSVTVVRDITEEKQLQAQKFAFLSNASHELRTPLTNFKTRLYLVRRQPERLKEHIAVLEQVTERMANLVEDLLDISRFERQTISLQRRSVVLQHMIEDVIQVQRPEALLKNIQLSTQMPEEAVSVNVDPNRIIQVLINLIINAINYTPHGGSIAVQLSTEGDPDGASAVIRVRDTGIGIAADKLARVFESFFRATEGSVRGTGLGLTITREIVELHGGRVSVESDEGQGSTFTVHLPLTVQIEAYEAK